jgi:hypothetical protein
MPGTRNEPVGVLVVRVWLERGLDTQLRARITQTFDIAGEDELVIAASSVEEVYGTVRQWLDDFVARGERPPELTGKR